MEYTEIVEKVRELYNTVSEFAYGEGVQIPEDFQFSEETTQLTEKYNDAYCKWKAHSGYNLPGSRDAEYEGLMKEFQSCKNPRQVKEIEYLESIGVGEIKEVAQHGGEGEGSTWYSVKFFPKHNIYIRVDGYYQSYNGTEFYDGWGCLSQCSPQERVITVYE